MNHTSEIKAPWAEGLRKHLNDKTYIQIGHGLGGYCVVLTPLVFAHTLRHLMYGVVAVNLWALFKEFAFDTFVKGQTWAASLADYRSYLLGALGARVVGLMAIARIL